MVLKKLGSEKKWHRVDRRALCDPNAEAHAPEAPGGSLFPWVREFLYLRKNARLADRQALVNTQEEVGVGACPRCVRMKSRTAPLSHLELEAVLSKLLAYCRANGWEGHDPYDALNSAVFDKLPVLNHRLPRLVFTQALKRSPVNVRRLLRIPTIQNPKANALFLSAFVRLDRLGVLCQQGDIELMIERLSDLRSPGTDYCCWGYGFPWQTRTIVVPSGAPNLVCTTFVAESLIDAYDYSGDGRCLRMAVNAAEYVLNELYWADNGASGFSYPLPSLRSQVHNANFMAAALLCRVHRYTGEEKFLRPAMRVARYSVTKQHPDGSWRYGEGRTQQWIDNFHTGYNLCALQAISRFAATNEFEGAVWRGFEFYRDHFMLEDGSVRYFHDRRYPIDSHCVAQSVLTLLAFQDSDRKNLLLAHSVLRWALGHLWDERGFFYYRLLRWGTNRISYMRWSQAWMVLAIAALLDDLRRGAMGPAREFREVARRAHD
jgi:hypothetical protein